MDIQNYNSRWFENVLKDKLPENVFLDLVEIFSKRIISKEQLSHFLCQCDHESSGFKKFTENLNYSSKRLKEIFPNRFKTIEDAKKITDGGQISIANNIYNGRMGNKTKTNDGWNTRGRGALQLTGMASYKEFDELVPEKIVEDGLFDLIATKYPITSAVWYFDKKKIWNKCINKSSVKKITRIINGGYIGLKEREQLYLTYSNLLKPIEYSL